MFLKMRLPATTALVALAQPALALEKFTFQTSWKAQAEHGGYYQAIGKGYYAACGLDLTIRQGGPGIDPAQLLAGGARRCDDRLAERCGLSS